MALTAAEKLRLERLYQTAVRAAWATVPVSQQDLQSCLLVNDGSDPVASVLNPSYPTINPVPVSV